jgi:hypothetical protein
MLLAGTGGLVLGGLAPSRPLDLADSWQRDVLLGVDVATGEDAAAVCLDLRPLHGHHERIRELAERMARAASRHADRLALDVLEGRR